MSDDINLLYKKYGPMVLRRCRGLLGEEQRALEAMQDTFIRVLEYTKKPNAGHYSSLLYKISTNICLNLIRTDSRKKAGSKSNQLLTEIAEQSQLEERFIAKDFLLKLFSLDHSTTAYMAVLHYYDQMTLQEVANETGLSVSGVRKRLKKLETNIRYLKEDQS